MLEGLRTVVYFVQDLEAAKNWYAEVLGSRPNYDTPYYVGFEVGGYELGLHPASESQEGVGGDTAYWGVPDVDAAMAKLTTMGAKVLQKATTVGDGIRLGTVVDPFGNALGLITNLHFRPAIPDDPQKGPIAVVPKGFGLGAAPGDVSDRTIVRECTISVPPAETWRLWTTSSGITSWLVPEARVELRIGGRYELLFAPEPEGLRGTEGCRVLAWIPGRMLAFSWNAPPNLPATRPRHTWVVIEVEASGSGTHVRLTHTGWPASGLAEPTSPWPATFAYFEKAWTQVMAALEAHAPMTRGA